MTVYLYTPLRFLISASMNPQELSFEEPNPRWIGARGPVTMMPTYLRNIRLLPEFRVEFLNLGGDATENHAAIQVNFAQTVNIGGVDYLGARISMDPLQYPHDAQNFRVCDSADDETRFRYMDAEDHYLPGVFTIRFNTYDRPSTASLHTVFFPMRSDLTLGELLAVATLNELHRFVFLPYKTSTGKAWKGCRDFVLQYWNLLASKGLVRPFDNCGRTLVNSIRYCYFPGERQPQPTVVNMGLWSRFSRAQTPALAPAYFNY